MKFERKAILILTKEERDFLNRFYLSITDEFDSINFTYLLDDITCKSSTYEQGDIIIDIKYEED